MVPLRGPGVLLALARGSRRWTRGGFGEHFRGSSRAPGVISRALAAFAGLAPIDSPSYRETSSGLPGARGGLSGDYRGIDGGILGTEEGLRGGNGSLRGAGVFLPGVEGESGYSLDAFREELLPLGTPERPEKQAIGSVQESSPGPLPGWGGFRPVQRPSRACRCCAPGHQAARVVRGSSSAPGRGSPSGLLAGALPRYRDAVS